MVRKSCLGTASGWLPQLAPFEMRRAHLACTFGTVSVADGRHRRVSSQTKLSDSLLAYAKGSVCSGPPQSLTPNLQALATHLVGSGQT